MSLEARKIFNFEEQRAKDVLQAIKTITPVISIIREWGKVEEEFLDVSDKLRVLKENISTLRKSLNIISDEFIRNNINDKIKKDSEELKELSSKEETLKEKCERLENEIIEYQRYVEIFKDINSDIMELVFKADSFENNDEYLAIIFIVLNIKLTNLDMRYLVKKYQESRWSNTFLLLENGWNSMLKSLKKNKI